MRFTHPFSFCFLRAGQKKGTLNRIPIYCLFGSGSFCLLASSLESLESTSGNANCRRLSVDYHMNFLKVDVPSAASCAQGV